MKQKLKRGLFSFLVLVMLVGLMPVTAFAAVGSNGEPDGVNYTLVLSIYTGEGFPGEPAVYDGNAYVNINSSFQTQSGATFAKNGNNQLNWPAIQADMNQGATNYSTTVWGVYDTTGLDKYFVNNATINDEEKESTIIQSVKGCSAEEAKKYEIVWYVIKFQHSRGSSWLDQWLGRGTSEWHIDGVIKEREKYSINYYGNGNTSGEAPLGTTDHPSDEDYKVLGLNDNNGRDPLKKVMSGVEVSFLGWSARADGSDTELAFYQPGDTISAKDLKEKYNGKLSLYAMWDTTTKHTATVNTYLDNVLADEEDIHDAKRELYLSPDKEHYYPLSQKSVGVYTTQITGNGKFLLYYKESDGNYVQVGNRQLTIYNQDGSMNVNHYSVTYDCDGGSFAADPGKQVYYYGDTVTAVTEQPTKEGYRFLGWKVSDDKRIQPGEEVTDSITAPITLTAEWEKTVNVTVNVTINHEGGDGFDQVPTKDDVFLALVSRENETSPYLEVVGKTLELGKDVTVPAEQLETKYLDNTFKDMPGGSVQYTVVTSKSGYDTEITATQDDNGDWTINVVMDYRPTNFDLKFTVEADPELLKIEDATGNEYLPDAAIVKVTFWATGKQTWEVITQQAGGSPGVRVDLDPETGKGSGSYPVWMYESNTVDPYMYRVRVTAFVYPDGSIVAVSDPNANASWTDQVYTATVEEEKINGLEVGKANGDLSDALVEKLDATLDGAYYSVAKAQTKGTDAQQGTLNIKITMPLYTVTFNANGGAFGSESETERTAEYQYKIPSFEDYVPTRAGGYTFAGWYLDDEFKTAATEGADLTESVTLYAKWIEPLTIKGKVNILGTYVLNKETVEVNEIDKAKEAIVVLMENRNGSFYEVDSQKVDFTYRADGNGDGDYSFTEIPNAGKEYRIQLLLLNYDTEYDNEGDDQEKQYIAVFGDDNEANVDAELTFVPPSYDQDMIVDATAISEDFRPENVLAKVIYRDTGDSHPYQVISQHRDSEKLGVNISLANGEGEGSESIWKWHTDGTLYEYQMYITEVDGEPYDVSAAPYYIVYEEPAYWNSNTNSYSNELKATLIPNEYPVVFDPNADGDEVTNMVNCTSYVISAENGEPYTIYVYNDKAHKWSDETNIAANDVPQPARVGYTFTGWTTTMSGVNIAEDDGAIEILGEVHTQVILQANWEKNNYTVTTAVDPTAGGTTTGDGTYEYGSSVTVVATPAEGYTFEGWYEGEKEVSKDLSYTIENITANRELVAQFSLKQCVVTTSTKPAEGGTTTGGGTFGHGTRVNVEAEAKTGYVFTGWYVGETQVCETAEYSFDVTGDRTLEARFAKRTYEVTATAQNGGSVTGGDTYEHGEQATVKAEVEENYTFLGWYEGETRVSGNLEYTFEVTSDRELTAKFKKDGLLIEANPNNSDHGTTSGSGYYDEDSTATVTATPKEGYKFLGWYVADEKVSAEASYSFTVTASRTLTAKFAAAYTVATVADPDGAGELEGAGLYTSEEKVTLRATATGNYYFVGWYQGDELRSTNAEYTLPFKLTTDVTFTAKFEKKVTYTYDQVYLFGYNDQQIGAEGTLLRGEVAQMIYRLVRSNGTGPSSGKVFEDTAGQWFQSGMAYMAQVGAIDGEQPKGYPYGAVTRGETYKMICLGLGLTDDTTLRFSEYAAILRNRGYDAPEGTVTGNIKRWQFCQLFNNIVGRSGYDLETEDGTIITADTYGYKDLNSEADYYRTMLLATSTFKDRKVDLEKRRDRNEFDYAN